MIRQILVTGQAVVLGLLTVHAIAQRSDEASSFLQRKERWAVKTGADPMARRIRTEPPQAATVAKLIHFNRPRELPTNATSRTAQVSRYGDVEHTVFTIDADIVRYKLEKDDHDYHIVIRDHDDFNAEDAPMESGRRRTMVVEIPEASVVAGSSPWRSSIASARRQFTELFHPQSRFTYRVIHARITGVGFFDFIHGQSGVAPNGIELHPVLRVDVLDENREVVRMHRSSATGAPAPDEVGSAKVWINLNSGAYWRSGTRYYGKTKRGKFMRESDAVRAGYHAAHGQ